MFSFMSNAVIDLAIKFPQHAPLAMRFLKKFDQKSSADSIGEIGLEAEGAGPAALGILKGDPGKDSTLWIGRIGYGIDELSKPVLEILKDRHAESAQSFIRDIGCKSSALRLQALEILKDREGDGVTAEIGLLARNCETSVARAAFTILKGRAGEAAASEITRLVRADHSLAPEILAELKSRTSLDSSLHIGYIGCKVHGMAMPALKLLQESKGTYADSEIEAIGRSVTAVKADAIRILIDRKSYDYARSLTMGDKADSPLIKLKSTFAARHYAVLVSGVTSEMIDAEYTKPLLGKILTGKEKIVGDKGELAELLRQAATIISAEKPANDNITTQAQETFSSPGLGL